ncbi:MAG: acetate kinase [Desulfomicrobiaceae bacterium]
MYVFVINSGSSSLKYQLLDMDKRQAVASGVVERIGEPMGRITHKKYPGQQNEAKTSMDMPFPDHRVAMDQAVALLVHPEHGVIASRDAIQAIGHRVVQGGETLVQSTRITPEVIAQIRANFQLSPLHNPANLVGIEAALELFPHAPQVAVFDTEFHQTMPPAAYLYPIPYHFYEEMRVRRYGFHGTSHRYVTREAARLMGKPMEAVNLVTLHLGNGCSMAAVRQGRCVDTTMGMTPLSGLMMGTRSGDIDPAIVFFLMKEKGYNVDQMDAILNKESGLKGICGKNDMRDIHEAAAAGDERARLALEMFVGRIRKFLGAYLTVTGPLDAIVFTAGIGENDDIVRRMVCQDLEHLGIVLDEAANAGRKGAATAVHAPTSRVQIWVIPTNEELEIAQATVAVLENSL